MSIHQIQQAICYMEEHILEDINYADVAKSVYMSGYNFHRTFSFIVGMTPNEYIRNRRLTLAARELRETDISVIDVAYKYGYESSDSFSKAFSRFHGSTPKQAKQKGAQLHLFNPLVIKIVLEGGSIMNYRIEHKESQRFIALVRSFPNEPENGGTYDGIPDFWDECYANDLIKPMKLLRAEGKRDLYGLCSPTKENEMHFNYGIGVIIDDDTDTSGLDKLLCNGYMIWETEPVDYAVFKCIGPDNGCIGETWIKFFNEFIPQTGFVQTDDTEIEIFQENVESGVFCELWIPVKKG